MIHNVPLAPSADRLVLSLIQQAHACRWVFYYKDRWASERQQIDHHTLNDTRRMSEPEFRADFSTVSQFCSDPSHTAQLKRHRASFV